LSGQGNGSGGASGAARSRDLSTWIVIAPAIGLLLLGVVFILSPRLGAAIFGIPAPDGAGQFYLLAIGLRDLAFGLYVAALALFSTPPLGRPRASPSPS
jgi:Domain of unknown function (DUF4267)